MSMTTTEGYIRQIEHVLGNDQHAVHNSPTVADLLREVADELKSLKGQVNSWVDIAAKEQDNTKAAYVEVVKYRAALNKIAWGTEPQSVTMTEHRSIAIDALAIGASPNA